MMGTGGERDVEVLIGHMGGLFWAGRESAAWSVPKGEYGPDEEPAAAARREFEEELGVPVPDGVWLPLGEARQRSGKTVTVWAVEAELDVASVVPGTFTMEWPRRLRRTAGVPGDGPVRLGACWSRPPSG
ncbi:hypothetical protein SMICM304S_01757 [Streptomyces microflavus]